MKTNILWSLRLGFSAQQANQIETLGIEKFLKKSFQSGFDSGIPSFLDNSPKSADELKNTRKTLKEANVTEKKDFLRQEIKTNIEMKAWWLQKMATNDLPLREKMTCFWHNHYVSTYQKVKVNYWIFQHNQILRENAFGNFKDLTKKIVKSNAMIRYLDNNDNRKNKLNENLSRELLELFTLGIGNYTENDIKNGAKGLAGLGFGENEAVYRKFFESNENFDYFGKNGNFKVDEMIDIIFQQPKIPFQITRKILKWFIYDNPADDLVAYYGNHFKEMNFEIEPLLQKIFLEEYAKPNEGSKIKSPLEFVLQTMDELSVESGNLKLISFFLKNQGMDLFNQPNVKGWDGGKSWLTSQNYLQRNNAADLLCSGKKIAKRPQDDMDMDVEDDNNLVKAKLKWNKNGNNIQIIQELSDRLLFDVDKNLQADFEQLLKYDFNPNTQGSDNAVLRLFNYMIKTPEYQII
jgi:uncharacterized protein (DUF1800 family)